MGFTDYSFCDIGASERLKEAAAELLFETFDGTGSWPGLDRKAAQDEVEECARGGRICAGLETARGLIGWAGLREMYSVTWEMQPVVIKKEFQKQGWGKILLAELESRAREKGVIGIFVGADDFTGATSLSGKEITGAGVPDEIKNVQNYKGHQYEFYLKCGYSIVGMIPNANGDGKPDILLWKDIRKVPAC